MNDDELYEKLVAQSISFISYRVRSASEIHAFLTQKLKKMHVIHGTIVDRVMERLTELQYIDDLKFAEAFIESRLHSRPKSTRTLIFELQKKGISEEMAKQVLSKSDRGGGDFELAKRAVERKRIHWKHLTPVDAKKKLFGYLSRRGFAMDVIRRVIDDGI